MKKIGNANLVTKETAEKLQLLKDWLPNKFDTTDFDVLERGKKQWVRLKPKASPDRGGGGRPLPFDVFLGKYEGTEDYYVTVAEGYVCDRAMEVLAGANSLFNYKPDNLEDAFGDPTKFPITTGQGIFVQVLEDEFGAIKPGADVILTVEAETKESRNFIPGTQDGEYYYKLAQLENIDGKPTLVYFLSGSHIYHATGLTADVVIRDCPYFPEGEFESVPGAQLIRMSFVSGKLVSVGEAELTRPYAETKHETTVMYCS